MKYQAIFFDLFNTLLHFDESRLFQAEYRGRPIRTSLAVIYPRLCDDWQLACSWEDFLDAFAEVSRRHRRLKADGRELPSLQRFDRLRRHLGIADEEVSQLMVDLHMEQMFRSMYLPEGNLEVLESLQGYPKVLASNFDHAPTVYRALKAFGLDRHLEAVFISHEVGWAKPSPRFFEAMLEKTGHSPDQCLYVGDDPLADCEGAGRAGFQVVWLNGSPNATQPSFPPRWRISRLKDLEIVLGREPAKGR